MNFSAEYSPLHIKKRNVWNIPDKVLTQLKSRLDYYLLCYEYMDLQGPYHKNKLKLFFGGIWLRFQRLNKPCFIKLF